MDQDESVDDPVEDAALLDDSCEIKRDSICVSFQLFFKQSFTGHTDSVLCVAFNPKKPFQLATGGQDDKAYLLQIDNEQICSLCLEGHQDSVCGLAYNATGEYLATVDMNGIIKVWNASNGQLLKSLEGPEEPEWIRWHNKVGLKKYGQQNNVLFVSGNDFCVWSWLLPAGKLLPVKDGAVIHNRFSVVTRIMLLAAISTLPVRQDRTEMMMQLLITGSLDNTVKLWKLKTNEMTYSFKAQEYACV